MVQLQVTIDIPEAMINAIREPTNANRGIRAIADAMALSMPAIVAAINSLPAQRKDNDIKIKHEADIANKTIVEHDASRPFERQRSEGPYIVQVQMFLGRSYDVIAKNHYTVAQLKEEIYRASMVEPCQQKLIFGGKVLQDETTLAELRDLRISPVHMMWTLRGS